MWCVGRIKEDQDRGGEEEKEGGNEKEKTR